MSIKEKLYEKALDTVAAILEQTIPAAARPADRHHRHVGKLGIVDRVRGGHVQLRKAQSDTAGYKVQGGMVVKMTPEEVRRRKIAGKISARKRRSEMAQILRKRLISMKIRSGRLGD